LSPLVKSFMRPCILSVQQLHIHYQQPNKPFCLYGICAKNRSKSLFISHNTYGDKEIKLLLCEINKAFNRVLAQRSCKQSEMTAITKAKIG
jgi:hypothetical protein